MVIHSARPHKAETTQNNPQDEQPEIPSPFHERLSQAKAVDPAAVFLIEQRLTVLSKRYQEMTVAVN